MSHYHIQRRDALKMALLFGSAPGYALAAEGDGSKGNSTRKIPAVPGQVKVTLQTRVPTKTDSKKYRIQTNQAVWEAAETAIIICDMWADHPCKLAAMRVDRMAARMNKTISLARDHGMAIIHAPSGGMKHYEQTSYRARMKQAKQAKPPVPIQSWCYLNPKKEAPLPIDDTKKRSPDTLRGCDDPSPSGQPDHDRHEHPKIKIIGFDGVSDSGQEIYNFLQQEGRKNIVLMGVHTNMCVLGRPFGIRQMRYLGENVVLCRDLTDAMYDPRDYPYVSHVRGTELVIEHIEKYWCPTIESHNLMKVIPGSNDPQIPT